jgi:Mannosyl-glycoprotein endo-beta-N-acetylglucosaminidase
MNSNILQIAPTFLEGARKLHDNLAGVTIICALCGLMIIASQAVQEKQLRRFWPLFVRMGVASFLLTGLGTWGDMLNDAMVDLINQAGWGRFPGSVAADYQAAIAKKWGTQSAAATQQTVPFASGLTGAPTGTQQLSGLLAGNEANFQAAGAANGVDPLFLEAVAIEETGNGTSHALAAYNNPAGIMDPSTPNDSGFYHYATLQDGINAEAANLQQNYIADGLATISAIGQKYAPAGAANDLAGTNANWGNEVAAIYQGLGGTSMSMGTAQATTGGAQGTGGSFNLMNPATWGPALISVIVNAIVYFISVAALICMIIMTIVQQLLYAIELAVSPIFIGLWLVPGLTNVATRFFTSLVAILLWPLGWVVSDLGTKFLLDSALNPTGNGSQTAISLAGIALSGGTLAVGFWILLAGWVVLSSFIAPGIVSALIVTGGSGIARVFANALGVGAYMAFTAAKSAGGGAGAASSVFGSAAAVVNSPVVGRASRPNYARRPPAPPPAVV